MIWIYLAVQSNRLDLRSRSDLCFQTNDAILIILLFRSLPTVIAYSESGTIVGYEAKQQQGRNLTNTFDKMKKLIATKNNEEVSTLLLFNYNIII